LQEQKKESFKWWYMNPWTSDEVSCWLLREDDLHEDTRQTLYEIHSGAIRNISESLRETACIDAARSQIREDINSAFPSGSSESTTQAQLQMQAVHRLLHWYATPGKRACSEVSFCSQYARELFLVKMSSTAMVNLLQMPSTGGEREAAVHGHFEKQRECRLTVRTLEGASVDTTQEKTLLRRNLVPYRALRELVRVALWRIGGKL
jgi:methyl coenzyme M reductase gamma subunit